MILKNTESGKLYKIASGFILEESNYKKLNVTASFLTLNSLDNGEELLYAWKYWAPNEFELVTGDEYGNGHDENSSGSGVLGEDSTAGNGVDAGSEGLSSADVEPGSSGSD